MRRYIPALLLTLVALSPFPLGGCDMLAKLKRGSGDAGDDAAAAVAVADEGGAATETATPPPTTPTTPTTPTAPTLTAGTPAHTATTVRPVTVSDAGVKVDAAAPVADAGAVKADAAAPSPLPTPTLPLSRLLDGGLLRFDAGAFKPPWMK